jgi:hypothetical protein
MKVNVTIDLAKKHLEYKPDDMDILRADLIKVIRVAEEAEKRAWNEALELAAEKAKVINHNEGLCDMCWGQVDRNSILNLKKE